MATITINVQLNLGLKYQVVVKMAGQVRHFQESGTWKIEDLQPKKYVMLIAGFQDVDNLDSTVRVTCKQSNKTLSDTTITDREFIQFVVNEVQ